MHFCLMSASSGDTVLSSRKGQEAVCKECVVCNEVSIHASICLFLKLLTLFVFRGGSWKANTGGTVEVYVFYCSISC